MTIVRIARRQVPSRRAFWPSTFEAKLVTEDGRELGKCRGQTLDGVVAQARRLAKRRGLEVDPGRCSWHHVDGWPKPLAPEDMP